MIFRGVPLPSMFLSYQWGHWIFCLGGGGGGGGDVVIGYYVLCFVYCVLVLVVCSIFSVSRTLVCFVFSLFCIVLSCS